MKFQHYLALFLSMAIVLAGLPPQRTIALHAKPTIKAEEADAPSAPFLRSNMRFAAPPQLAEFPGACQPREAVGQAPPKRQNDIMLPAIFNGVLSRIVDTFVSDVAMSDAQNVQPLAIPHDPSLFATPLDNHTTFGESVAFLYTGENAVQTGVAADAIDPAQAAVLRGLVLAQNGEPLSGVKIQIFGHTEYGQTVSRADGAYDMVVNAGQAVICFELPGHLPTQRIVNAKWNDFTTLENVVVLPMDNVVSTIDLANSSEIQVAQNSPTSDSDGNRQSTLLFEPNTGAEMVMADGSTKPLSTLSVRATEYTVGENGPQAMPGDLPFNSGYTYAVEFTVDEALTAGAVDVRFDKPLINYVENFLDFPAGTAVPTGYYDRGRGAWVPSANGQVIEIISINNGISALDVEGIGRESSAAALAELGIDEAERRTIAQLYSAGQSLWRVPIPHFTPWDHNWPYGPPDDATPPNPPSPQPDTPDEDSCEQDGSIIECQNQTLGERIPVAGTPFSLNYRSSRVPARELGSSITIPVTGDTVPASLARVVLEMEIAGKKFTQSFEPNPNQSVEFQWDGKDIFNRPIPHARLLNVRLGYEYPAVYRAPGAAFQNSFGRFGGAQFSRNMARREITIWRTWKTRLQPKTWDARVQALGGWTLDPHHFYDVGSNILHLGDGGQTSSSLNGGVLRTIAGIPRNGDVGLPLEDGLPATEVRIAPPIDIAASNDGTLYFSSTLCLYKIDQRGRIYHAMRGTTNGCTLPIAQPNGRTFVNPLGISLAPNGDLYAANHGNNGIGGEVLRVRPDGTVSSVAGNGERGYSGDGGPATEAAFSGPFDVAVAPDGSFYVADFYNKVVRHVGLDGIITTVAGGGDPADGLGDGGPATEAKLGSVRVVTVDQEGVLYIGHDSMGTSGLRVRRVGLDGVITTAVGGGDQLHQENELGTDTLLSIAFYTLTIGPDNSLYINDAHRIRRLGPDGRMTTVAGSTFGYSEDGTPILDAKLAYASAAFAPDGSLYLAELNNSLIRKTNINQSNIGEGEVTALSNQGTEVHVFNLEGVHQRTIDALTGATLYTFGYDNAERLTSMTDVYGKVTHVERNAEGLPLAIVASSGQRTQLETDGNGYLTRVATPGDQSYAMGYHGAGGLLASFTDPGGQETTMAYDERGRLLADSHSHAVRGDITLNGSTTADGKTVEYVSAAGRVTTYSLNSAGAETVRRTTFADGTQTRSIQQVDGSQVTVLANGTELFSNEKGSPQWLGSSTEPVTTRITTPSGRSQETVVARSTLYADPTDPASMIAMTSTVTTNGRRATTIHDLVNNQVQVTTPAGRSSMYQLNDIGDVTQVQLPGLHPETRTYDEFGRPKTVTQGAGSDARTTTYAYNDEGLVSSITDGLNRTWAMAYDANGQITALTLPDGSMGRYAYDANGRRTSVTPPGRQPHTFTYSTADLADTYRPPDVDATDPTIRYSYDGDGLLTNVVQPDGVTLDYLYDPVGRLTTVQTPGDSISRTYASDTGMLSEIRTADSTLSFAYDGRLTTETEWAGAVTGQVGYQYSNDLRLQSIQVNGRWTFPLRYDADDLLTQAGELMISRSAENGFVTGSTLRSTSDALTYNSFGEVASYVASVNSGANREDPFSVNYTYDAVGRISQRTEQIDGVETVYGYGYDLAGRLETVTQNGSAIATYGYDANSNRTSMTEVGATISASYDAQDRLLQYGDATFTYTANGELRTRTEKGETTTYYHNALGNLASVALPDGREISYVSDGLNRRIGKRVDGALVQGFLYLDELHPVAELDGESNIVSLFVYGSEEDTPSYMVRGNVVYRIFSDHVGSPRVVINTSSGEVVQRMTYDTFGNVLEDTNPGFQPFGFAGGLYDRDTGLVRFGARDYDATVGRWTSKDPVFFEAGSFNLYTYVYNDPVNFTDPSGEAIPLLAALGIAWVVAETAMTASDILDFFDKLFDPCVNTGDKAVAGLLVLLGIVGPGGGYGKLKKFFDKFADLFKNANRADTVKDVSKLDDAYRKMLKSMDIDPNDVKAVKGPPGTKPSPRNDVGSYWDN